MTEQTLRVITLISESVIYFLIVLTILRQRNFRAQAVQALGLYTAVSLLLALLLVAGGWGSPSVWPTSFWRACRCMGRSAWQ